MSRRGVGLLAGVALAALIGLGVPAAIGQAPGPISVSLSIEPRTAGRAIPPGFVGFAMEYRGIRTYTGSDPTAVNPVIAQLIRNLDPGQSPVLRIGGDSTDWTWWPVRGVSKPAGARYDLTPSWIGTTKALAVATHAHLILGINLEANRPQVASVEARALLKGFGRGIVQAFELGNEPELYGALPWTHTSSGAPELGRPPTYGPIAYSSDFARVRRAMPSIPLAAPATGNLAWLSSLPSFLAAQPTVKLVTIHRYPLNRCDTTPSTQAFPTVGHLLAQTSSRGLLQGAQSYINWVRGHGLQFRVGEMGSVTCGGVWGVSNTFASSLWILDSMFAIASMGVDGVNLQTAPFPGSPNQLFTFHQRHGVWESFVRPMYYGLLMFVEAAPPGAHLLHLTTSTSGPLSMWATQTPTHTVNFIAINESRTRAATIHVKPPSRSGTATLSRLLANSAYSIGGVTLAGQTYGPKTTTGQIGGTLTTTRVSPTSAGYAITVPPASAAMLSIPG